MSWFLFVARIAFGLLFVASSVDKILHPGDFARIILNYRILPELLANPVAIVLPWVELVCGLALVAGRLARGAAVILNALLVVFLAALAWNMVRGVDVACGCFSVRAEAGGNMALYLVRDSAILLLGLAAMAGAFRRGSRHG